MITYIFPATQKVKSRKGPTIHSNIELSVINKIKKKNRDKQEETIQIFVFQERNVL